MIKIYKVLIVSCCFLFSVGVTDRAFAAEGGSSNYFPGGSGSLLVAVAPETGFVLADSNLFYSASIDEAVLQGKVNINMEVSAYYNLLQGQYTWDAPGIGGRFSVGGYASMGSSSLAASIEIDDVFLSADVSETSFGDMGIIPASFYWNFGKLHLNLYELIVIPTGEYDVNKSVNIGRNYWSFDTVVAATWFNPSTGTDISLIVGLMANTENDATQYNTGTEFHVDYSINRFISETVSLGIRGNYYKQLSGDSGEGAILGDFKGESAAIGVGFSWMPKFGAGKFAVIGTWLHDVTATNRFKANYGNLTLAYNF